MRERDRIVEEVAADAAERLEEMLRLLEEARGLLGRVAAEEPGRGEAWAWVLAYDTLFGDDEPPPS